MPDNKPRAYPLACFALIKFPVHGDDKLAYHNDYMRRPAHCPYLSAAAFVRIRPLFNTGIGLVHGCSMLLMSILADIFHMRLPGAKFSGMDRSGRHNTGDLEIVDRSYLLLRQNVTT